MKNPDINLQVEIREEAAIFPMKLFIGAGGSTCGKFW